MIVLSIDTSTAFSGMALLKDDRLIGEYNVNQEKLQSESLAPMIVEMLRVLQLDFSDIDLYAVATGPGSFTGLRIGVTLAKTFAQVNKKPVLGISTLEAMAFQIGGEKLIVPVIDARGRRLYYGAYRHKAEGPICVLEDDLRTVDALAEYLAESDEEVILCGDIVSKYASELSGPKVSFAEPHRNNGIARSLAVLGAWRRDQARAEDVYRLAPRYLRKSQAQMEYEWRHGK
jgi:tRNA threonylcarbamoyladenosine biosynthesis protein TsaB